MSWREENEKNERGDSTTGAAAQTMNCGDQNPKHLLNGSDVCDGEYVDNGSERGAAMLEGKASKVKVGKCGMERKKSPRQEEIGEHTKGNLDESMYTVESLPNGGVIQTEACKGTANDAWLRGAAGFRVSTSAEVFGCEG